MKFLGLPIQCASVIASNTNGGSQSGLSTAKAVGFITSGQGTDQNKWDFYSTGATFLLRALNDAEGSFSAALQITRTGTTITGITLGGPVAITGGAINSTTVGATTPSTVKGTTVSATTSVNLPVYTVATLPAAGTAGRMAFCSNARMETSLGSLEASGSGTGGLVVDNGTAWKVAGTNITASA